MSTMKTAEELLTAAWLTLTVYPARESTELVRQQIKEYLDAPKDEPVECVHVPLSIWKYLKEGNITADDLAEAVKKANAEEVDRSEPVAWLWDEFMDDGPFTVADVDEPPANEHRANIRPLFLHPPTKTVPQKPMKEEEMAYGFTEPRYSQWQAFVAGVKWSESHQGIGGSDEKGS